MTALREHLAERKEDYFGEGQPDSHVGVEEANAADRVEELKGYTLSLSLGFRTNLRIYLGGNGIPLGFFHFPRFFWVVGFMVLVENVCKCWRAKIP